MLSVIFLKISAPRITKQQQSLGLQVDTRNPSIKSTIVEQPKTISISYNSELVDNIIMRNLKKQTMCVIHTVDYHRKLLNYQLS